MKKIEIYSDKEGNSVTIVDDFDGVSVNASIKTKAPYVGGANVLAARSYAEKNDLKKQ